MKRRLFTALLAALPTIAQVAPAIAQTNTAAAPTDPNVEVSLPGLYYDPDEPSTTFGQLPGAEQAGYVEVPPLPPGVELPYLVDRAWPQGATPDQILKFGDLEQNPATVSFTEVSLRELTAPSGTNIGDVPVGDVALLNGLTIQQVDDLYTKINNGEEIKLEDAAPVLQAAFGLVTNPGAAPEQLQNAALTVGERVALDKLSKIPALEGIPLQDLARGNWEGVIDKADQIKLAGIGEKIGPYLKKLPLKQIVPIIGSAIDGNWRDARRRAIALAQQKGTEVAVKELLKEFPELKKVPIAAIPGVLSQPIDQALPQIADIAIKNIPGAKDKTINSVPGLEDIPINELPFDLAFSFFAGDVFARFDIAYSGVEGKEEPSVNHTLSGGSEDQKFKPIKCTIENGEKQRADNCPHFEMRKFIDSVAETAGLDSDIEGKQWVQGDSGGKNGQGVKGGKGFLKVVNGGWEPSGIHPFGVNSHTKFVLKKITEYPDKKSTAKLSLAFQFCITVPFLGQQCTPHFLVIPTPFTVKEDGLFLVASRRNLSADIARLRNQTLSSAGFLNQVYCDPDQIIATAGQADTPGSSPPDNKYGHRPYKETTEDLYEVTSVDGVKEGLTKDAAQAFEQMRSDAAQQGLDIRAVSGFRDVASQEQLWKEQVASQGSPEAAAKISAPPGHSEHHTGLAVDVGTNANPNLDTNFANTPEYAWLQENAGKYGFELSFPEGGTQGAGFEPWHWRYVGTEQAEQTFAVARGTSTTSTQSSGATDVSQWGSPTDIHNLIVTSVLESTGVQNQVDVAVSIMNRVNSPNFPNTITEVVYQSGQYEPNFGYSPVTSKEEAIQRIALKTGSIESAIQEYETLEAALNDPRMIAESQAFLGGATDFRGQVLLHNMKSGDPYRGGAGANFFLKESQNPELAANNLGSLGARSASSGMPCNPAMTAGVPGALTPEGNGVATGKLSNPAPGYPVTSEYGYRTHPVTGVQGTFHAGIDIGAPPGTPVTAADGGTVDFAGFHSGGHGNLVVIYHGNGLATWYAHNSAINVRVGQKVSVGDKLAEVGSTGTSTGPHLDFGVRTGYIPGQPYSGQHQNPRNFVNF
jgi:LAS superfamily LD-carboxypeptidase LdcB